MTSFLISLAGGMVFLLVAAVYSAVFVSRKTEELIAMQEEREARGTFIVRFPQSVMRSGEISHSNR